jgi:site-specific DNA recombinase
VGEERCTINTVCRRLHQAGILTQTGKAYWDHKTIWDRLKNPAYKGQAAFGKTRWLPVAPRLRAPKGRPELSRRGYSGNTAPKDEWITIPVPALVDCALYDAVQEQLEENRRRARIPEKGSRYLLQGLLVCAKCGYAYCGRTNDARNAYYRCAGAMNIPRHGFERVCWNKEIRMDQTDAMVWQAVCQLLENPQRLEQEYYQRLDEKPDPKAWEVLSRQIDKLQRGIERLIDSYADGLIEKGEFEPRIKRLRERIQHLGNQVQGQKDAAKAEEEIQNILGCLENFAAKVKGELQQADFATRRTIIRTLVKRVEVDEQQIRVVFRVRPSPDPPGSETTANRWQHCGERVLEPGFQFISKSLIQRLEFQTIDCCSYHRMPPNTLSLAILSHLVLFPSHQSGMRQNFLINGETTLPNNLVLRAEEKKHVSGTEW